MKPSPFQRPSVDLSEHGRSWQKIPAWRIEIGDTIPDFGSVQRIIRKGKTISLAAGISEGFRTFHIDDVVRVFTKG